MINPKELRSEVIKPVCDFLGLGGENVEELLLCTAMQESHCGAHLRQVGGPALGIWQTEPATHDDIWKNFLAFRADLSGKVSTFLFTALPKPTQLIGNIYYACAMARLQYYRSPDQLPAVGDIQGYASVYLQVYNTSLGKATRDEFIRNAQTVLA